MPSLIVLLALCYTILLRPVPDSVLSLNAMIDAKCFELSRHVFPTLIYHHAESPSFRQ